MTMTISRRRLKRCLVAVGFSLMGLASLQYVSNDYATFFGLTQDPLWRSAAHRRRSLRHFHGIFSDEQATSNKVYMQAWRTQFEALCNYTGTSEHMLRKKLKHVTRPSLVTADTHQDRLPVEPCKKVFLDYGANVGDSLEKLISAGIPKCMEKINLHPRYNATTGSATQGFRGGNQLVSWTWNRMKDASPSPEERLQPEDYCYFGIEGNPIFNERLKGLEQSVMRMDPRPVRRAHFFLETVGAGVDGPTVLYLDTFNGEHNHWGSSLLAEHVDVKKSAEQNSGSRVEQKVQGISLASMIQETVLPYRSSHVMIKMDIEGGEFQVIEAAAKSGVLCQYVKEFGVRIDMIIELHGKAITGDYDEQAFNEAKNTLMNCGVSMWQVKDAGR